MKAIEMAVKGDPAFARQVAGQALESRKFRITWHDEWTATAERGNKVANALAGALAQYFKVGLILMSTQPGETVVRFERQSRGFMGGAIGARRTTKNMEQLRDEVAQQFQQQGVLNWVREEG